MGMHDIPAMIDHILENTQETKLVYVAHSQGTTAFFVTASMRPEYNEKVSAFIAMAPVAFLGHVASLPLKIIAKAVTEVEVRTRGKQANIKVVENFSRLMGFESTIFGTGSELEGHAAYTLYPFRHV